MEWKIEDTCKLIEIYREKVELWDTHSPLYKNKQKKHDAWKEIGAVFDLGKEEVEKKMRCLIGQFQREQKKTKSGTGTGADEVYQSKWFAFKMLKFLQDRNKPRETIEAGIEKTNNNELLESDLNTTNDIQNMSESEEDRNSPTASSSTARPLPQPVGKKRTMREAILDKRQEEAYSVLQSLKRNANQRDEYDVYGELIAKKIRKLDENIRDEVMHEIDNILFKAKSGNRQYDCVSQWNYRNLSNQHQPNSSIVGMSRTQLPYSSLLPSPYHSHSSQSSNRSTTYIDTQNSQQPSPSSQVESQYSLASPLYSPRPCSQVSSYSENDFSHPRSPYGENQLLSSSSTIPPNSQLPIVSYQSKTQEESDKTPLSNVRDYVSDFDPQNL